MDRSPAVRLGKGMAQSLSPDGRWALAIDLVQNTLLVLPTGAGEPRTLPRHHQGLFMGGLVSGRQAYPLRRVRGR
jgi:hypothetical protein